MKISRIYKFSPVIQELFESFWIKAKYQIKKEGGERVYLGSSFPLSLGNLFQDIALYNPIVSPLRSIRTQWRISRNMNILFLTKLPQFPLLPKGVHLHL